jgi:putative ABC transport system permease protein
MLESGSRLRVAVRGLLSAPVPTTLALTALTLGIGANVAIFSAVGGVLLSPLPYAEPDRVVQVWTEHVVSPQLFQLLEQRLTTVVDLDASQSVALALLGDSEAWEVSAGQVTSAHFAMLGARPALGRSLLPADQKPGAEPVVVLSHGLWQSRFGGDAGVVGRKVRLGDDTSPSRTVVGVMPAGHRPLEAAWQAWVPLLLDPSNRDTWSDNYGLRLHARLRRGESVASATAELRAVATLLATEDSQLFVRTPASASVARLQDVTVGDLGMQLLLLAGAGVLVLLVACANVANLMLTRGVTRQRELAIRTALGASRGHLIRQLLTESVVVGLVGSALGVSLAVWLVGLLRAVPADLPRIETIRVGGVALAFALALGLASSLLAGIVPALRASRAEPRHALVAGGRSVGGRQRLQSGLVMLEVSLAVVLVVGAGLLVRSAARLQGVDPGFQYQSVLALRLSPPASRYQTGADLTAYYRRVLDRLAQVPGVEASGAAALLPLAGGRLGVGFEIDGRVEPGERPPTAEYNPVAGDFLKTLGVPLLKGRWLDASDARASRPTGVLVNRAFVERFFPAQDPIGHRLTGEGEEWMRIVGVVGDVRQRQLDARPQPAIYPDHAQDPLRRLYVVVRTGGDPARYAAAVRAALADVDPLVPVVRFLPMSEVVSGSLTRTHLFTGLLVAFALTALMLGAVGIYGVVSYGVSQRTREIGVRMALGADRHRVLGSVLGAGLRPVVFGLVAGLALAASGSRVLSAYLYEVTRLDPLIYGVVAAGVLLVGVVAVLGPARRAAWLDPLEAMREE